MWEVVLSSIIFGAVCAAVFVEERTKLHNIVAVINVERFGYEKNICIDKEHFTSANCGGNTNITVVQI